MALYSINNNGQLEQVREFDFKLEKEIQNLAEENLTTIFGLKFIKSEFAINSFRIDSLAFDNETKSFVIIEYKRDKNFSVIDQGYAYLSLMLNNKADFVLEYNETQEDSIKRDDVDWSQSKVMFVSPSFTPYQREAINFKDLPIELWEIKRYNNKTVNFSKIQTGNTKESVKTISRKNIAIENVSKEIMVYTEDGHLTSATEETKELYDKLKKAILNLEDLEIQPKKMYIAFVGNTNVVDIIIQRNALKLHINLKKGELDDSKNLSRDVSGIGHLGNGDFELQIQNDENLEYIMSLIKQSVKKNKS